MQQRFSNNQNINRKNSLKIKNNSFQKTSTIYNNTLYNKQMTSEIKFLVELDENRVPEKLAWTAKDGGIDLEETKAIMLSVWDNKAKETLRIDLWTKDMPVDEMKQFFHQTFVAMTDTFQRATQQTELVAEMKAYAKDFYKKFRDIQLKENK